MDGIPVIQRIGAPPQLVDVVNQQLQRQEQFGHGHPAVHAYWKGQQWIAVGNKLFHSDKWRTPIDFLSDYMTDVMTPAWGKAELRKPLADRHPIMQWYDATCRLQAKVKDQVGPDGLYAVKPSGAMWAYMLLAFDLYTIQRNSSLQERVLHRLRNHDQFQGARHELFATATCIRAGFEIQYEDETDGSVRHVEFTAIHKLSRATISVEAKSRGRPGVFAIDGDRQTVDRPDTRLRGLVNNATSKPHEHPLVLFLDLNLPPTAPMALSPDWFSNFADPIVRGIDRRGEDDPWELIAFSNHPYHYSDDDASSTAGYAAVMFAKKFGVGTPPPPELNALFEAARKFGTLPNRFEDM